MARNGAHWRVLAWSGTWYGNSDVGSALRASLTGSLTLAPVFREQWPQLAIDLQGLGAWGALAQSPPPLPAGNEPLGISVSSVSPPPSAPRDYRLIVVRAAPEGRTSSQHDLYSPQLLGFTGAVAGLRGSCYTLWAARTPVSLPPLPLHGGPLMYCGAFGKEKPPGAPTPGGQALWLSYRSGEPPPHRV